MMVKAPIFFMLIFYVFVVSTEAAVYKGQLVYKKRCLSCHTVPQKFLAKKTISEWKEVFKIEADNEDYKNADSKSLADIHLKNKSASKSWRYFKSSKYEKKLKHLVEFLVEFASDSGNVPACN